MPNLECIKKLREKKRIEVLIIKGAERNQILE